MPIRVICLWLEAHILHRGDSLGAMPAYEIAYQIERMVM